MPVVGQRDERDDETHAPECRDRKGQRHTTLGALLGLGAADREAVAAMYDVHVVGLGAGEHHLFGSHLPQLLLRGAVAGDAAHPFFTPIHRMASMSAPTPATQTTTASDTGPIRAMP